jgi:coenzyme F420-0:L-glutamate ligase
MIVTALKTDKLAPGAPAIETVLDKSLSSLAENTVLAVTSKIVAICEGRTIPIANIDNKRSLIIQEADHYLPEFIEEFDFTFTISHRTLIPSSGIDESNGNGHYILWPKDPFASANRIRQYLIQRFSLNNVGVIITDSTARPLHYGTEGVTIGYSGFAPANDYRGTKDLFGRKMKVSVSNVADALASAAVLVMGEGTEQTPLAIIEDLPFVNFQDHNPTKEELNRFLLEHMDDDLFAPLLRNSKWQKGGRA